LARTKPAVAIAPALIIGLRGRPVFGSRLIELNASPEGSRPAGRALRGLAQLAGATLAAWWSQPSVGPLTTDDQSLYLGVPLDPWSYEMPLPKRDLDRHTYAEYLTWPEAVRYELIEGEAYAMAPAPSRAHQRLLGELFRQIAGALDDSPCEVNLAPFDVRLPDADEADEDIATVVQPDISVVCDPAKLDERGCRGAPDWIIEILSPGSAGHDQIRKLAIYERHGVREYWLAHPVDRVVTLYRLADGVYGRPSVHEMEGRLACGACPRVEIDWARVVKGLANDIR